MRTRWLAATLGIAAPAHSLHNAIYYDHPPMGWRSWNVFGGEVDQAKMQEVHKRE